MVLWKYTGEITCRGSTTLFKNALYSSQVY